MRLNYVMKFVADMDKAVVFYRDALGLTLKLQSPGWSEFVTGETTLALHPASERNPAGSAELGSSVDDLERFHGEAARKGIVFTRLPAPRHQRSPLRGVRLRRSQGSVNPLGRSFQSRRRTMNLHAALIGAGLALLGIAPASAASYDAVSGFALTNPSGPWSYTYAGAPFTIAEPTPNGVGVPYWWTGLPVPLSGFIGQNVSGATVDYLTIEDPNNTLWLDPESYTNVAVTFTAPSAGTYTLSTTFSGIDTGERSHGVEVLDDGSAIYSNTISSFGASDTFSDKLTLAAGDTISFVVEGGSLDNCGYCNLGTGLVATLNSAVPEPATWAMLLIGFGLAGAALRRSSPRPTPATA
jgi:catechol 2,3-dioxygenase-like lactoylglutathione lyase family enzyme